MPGGCLAFLLQRSQAHLNLRGSFEHSKKLLLQDAFQISCLTAVPLPCFAIYFSGLIQQLLTSLGVKLMDLRVSIETALAHESQTHQPLLIDTTQKSLLYGVGLLKTTLWVPES